MLLIKAGCRVFYALMQLQRFGHMMYNDSNRTEMKSSAHYLKRRKAYWHGRLYSAK